MQLLASGKNELLWVRWSAIWAKIGSTANDHLQRLSRCTADISLHPNRLRLSSFTAYRTCRVAEFMHAQLLVRTWACYSSLGGRPHAERGLARDFSGTHVQQRVHMRGRVGAGRRPTRIMGAAGPRCSIHGNEGLTDQLKSTPRDKSHLLTAVVMP